MLDWGTPPSQAAANAPDDERGVTDRCVTARPDGSSAAPSEQKLALMRNLATSLIEQRRDRDDRGEGQGAPSVRREAHHQGAHAARCTSVVWPAATSRSARSADKLFQEIGPKFATRAGGYTRILKTGHRKGDGAEMARIELVEG